jgi:hypothetical protein
VLRKAAAGLVLGLVALLVAMTAPHGPAPAAAQCATAAEDGLHHAAIVVDTGDGQVRKLCLAFPEAELDGIEALRRVDTRPYRFETFGSKGVAVCMLCGVGCPSGDCFCDSSRYWAYFRAGPGGEPYQASRAGASSTTVRDGDVEGWKWGKGEAPPATTVSETCGVPEPPKRTAATTSTTAAGEPATTAPPPEPTSITAAPAPAPGGGPAVTTTTTRSGAPANGPTTAVSPPLSTTVSTAVPGGAGTDEPADRGQAALASEAGATGRSGRGEQPVSARPKAGGGGIGGLAGAIGFAAVLLGLLGWRVRLRRAKAGAEVRPVTPVR